MKTIEEIKDEVANSLIYASDWNGKISGWYEWNRHVMPSKTQYDMAYHKVIEAYASQFTSPIDKWVSVKEKAPNKSGLYLTILAETEDQYIAYYKSNRNTFEIYGLGRVQPVTDMNVTHWQPLPNPPTK